MSKEIIDQFLITTNKDSTDRRIFFASENIDIFPCSRRGQNESNPVAKFYDPEARLNTERTNRIRAATNGLTGNAHTNANNLSTKANEFTSSFIDSFDSKNNKLIFILAGYRVEVRHIDLDLLGNTLLDGSTKDTVYAHLSLHDNVSLMVDGYFTEILYCQSTEGTDVNSLDIASTVDNKTAKFFVGISFTAEPDCKDLLGNRELVYYNLPIFSMTKNGTAWQSELVQTSLLPKIEHGETENSVKIPGDSIVAGDFAVEGDVTVGNKITTKDLQVSSGATVGSLFVDGDGGIYAAMSDLDINNIRVDNSITTPTLAVGHEARVGQLITGKITQNGAAVPAVALEQDGEVYRLQITLDASKK